MEVQTSLDKQNSKGSPGSDWLTPGFYSWVRPVIAEDLFEVFNNSYMHREMTYSMKPLEV